MNKIEKTTKDEIKVIDKKRVFVAVLVATVLIGAGTVWAKNALLPKIADKIAQPGQVAGTKDTHVKLEQERQELQERIEGIKESVTQLKPEDIKEQAPVQKILSDLDDLSKKASESTKILDVKGNLCEEAKKRFCQ